MASYLQKYNNFKQWPTTGKYWHVREYPENIDEYDINNDNQHLIDQTDKLHVKDPTAYFARKLANKIDDNRALFIELEYLVRKTDQDNAKSNIDLIIQHLQCPSVTWTPVFNTKKNLYINEETPLYALGFAASPNALTAIKLNIITTQKMAPICHLFTEICAQVGWKVPLIFANGIEEYYDKNKDDSHEGSYHEDTDIDIMSLKCVNVIVKDGACRCTGVVTESADISSAMNLFIKSSVTVPWKLQRLYVQESVYDEVKSVLASKCTRELVNSCDDAFVTEGKIFVCDPLGEDSSKGDKACVLVEAYRTTKELCALLAQHPTPSLSLWAADSQVAHEVSLLAPSSLVWINEYATFYGPPLSSLPVYEASHPRVPFVINENTFTKVTQLSKAWEKITRSDRINLIINPL